MEKNSFYKNKVIYLRAFIKYQVQNNTLKSNYLCNHSPRRVFINIKNTLKVALDKLVENKIILKIDKYRISYKVTKEIIFSICHIEWDFIR